jgi:hypothetical protein
MSVRPEDHYPSADTVRAMCGVTSERELSAEDIDTAARDLGWPEVTPHPYLVAQRLEDVEP